jgi:glycosyltransferase involved in cell wall biosynthesis
MKVAHFCTFPHGGAAAAAKRQHHGLLAAGVDSRFYYFRNEQDVPLDETFEQVEFPANRYEPPFGFVQKYFAKRRQRRIYRQFDEHLASRTSEGETYAMSELAEPTVLDWRKIDADVVNLHWLSYFADFPSFFKSIPSPIPIVWTLHDTHAFTGGCHYTSGCLRAADGCGACPQVSNPNPQDVSLASFLAKRSAYSGKQIHVVAPCDWMLGLARRSSVWPHNATFKKIEYGLDLSRYFPVDKKEAREKLGLDPSGKFLAFGAMEIENPRKGVKYLLRAIGGVDCECLVFGDGEIEQGPGLPKLHNFGFVDSLEKLRLIYSAADLVAVPSVEDNQPQVGLEAMACGTPVVAFDASGMPEYVQDGKTGWLATIDGQADAVAVQNLAAKIKTGLRADESCGRNALKAVQQRFEVGQQTKKWFNFYRRLAAKFAKRQ